jgi:hypothetical protein
LRGAPQKDAEAAISLVSAGTCGGNAKMPAWGPVALTASSPSTARQSFAVRHPVRLDKHSAPNSFLRLSPPDAQCLTLMAKTAAAARDFPARPRCGSKPSATNSLALLRRHCASTTPWHADVDHVQLGLVCAKLCKHRNVESGVEPKEAATVGYSIARLPLCHSRRSMVVCGFPPYAGG